MLHNEGRKKTVTVVMVTKKYNITIINVFSCTCIPGCHSWSDYNPNSCHGDPKPAISVTQPLLGSVYSLLNHTPSQGRPWGRGETQDNRTQHKPPLKYFPCHHSLANNRS